MKRKTNFQQMFLVDNMLYRKLNNNNKSKVSLSGDSSIAVPAIIHSEPKQAHSSVKDMSTQVNLVESKVDAMVDRNESTTSPLQEEVNRCVSNYMQKVARINDQKIFDADNPIIKALKNHHEQVVKTSTNTKNETEYELTDDADSENSEDVPELPPSSSDEIEYAQMMKDINGEIENWQKLKRDAVRVFKQKDGKMKEKEQKRKGGKMKGKEQKRPRYTQYFTKSEITDGKSIV